MGFPYLHDGFIGGIMIWFVWSNARTVWIKNKRISKVFGLEETRLEHDFEIIIEQIVSALRSAGYEPYDQLYGYLKTGDETYITRTGDARRLISGVDRASLAAYVETLKPDKRNQ